MKRTILGLAAALPLVAHAAPSIKPIVEPVGVKLSSTVADQAYCNVSQRAIALLRDGSVVAIDASGTTTLGNVGRIGVRHTIACNGNDDVLVTRGAELATIDRTGMTTATITTEPITARALDDGTVAYVDSKGVVTRWDGSQITETWSLPTPPKSTWMKFLPSPSGKAVAVSSGGVAIVHDSQGNTHAGPRASAVQWDPDGKSLLAMSSAGLVRWVPGTPATQVTVVDAKARGFMMYAAGQRMIVGTLASGTVIELDHTGAVKSSVALTRWPWGFSRIAAGTGQHAVVLDRERAVVIDLAQAGHIIDEQHPTQPIRALAFSPDGRTIAFSGGDSDLILADTKSTMTERFARKSYVGMSAQHIRWLADGSVVEANGFMTIQWTHDGVATETRSKDSIIGLDASGKPIDASKVTCPATPKTRLANRPQTADQHGKLIAVRCSQGIVFAKDGTTVAEVTDFAHVFGIAGTKTPRLVFGRHNKLMIADAKGQRELAVLAGSITAMSISRDRKLAAIATTSDEIVVFDIDAEKQLLAATNPRGMASAMAWAPNGKSLAVASTYAVDLVQIKR